MSEGLKHDSWILCDNLVSVRKTELTHRVGSLSHYKIIELDRALKMHLPWIEDDRQHNKD